MGQQITKTLVEPKDRLNTLPSYFGKQCIKFEQLVYAHMDEFCPDYNGGMWDFYRLSNGGFFMSYDHDEALTVLFPANYFEDSMSAEAVSIGVNLFALNALAWKTNSEKIVDLYYALRDFAAEHPEGGKIMRLID